MNKNERPSFLKGKGTAVSIVLCFAAVIVLVGAYTFSNYRKDMEEQMARAEEQAEESGIYKEKRYWKIYPLCEKFPA